MLNTQFYSYYNLMILQKWNESKIDLDKYIEPDDLALLRNKKNRKNKNNKNTIITRNLELVTEAKGGNIEARNYLFLLNTPFIRSLLLKHFKIPIDKFNDYLHDSFFFFQEAVDEFDIKKSNNFIAMLSIKIISRFKNEIFGKNLKRNIIKNNTVYIEDFDKVEIENKFKTELDFIYDADRCELESGFRNGLKNKFNGSKNFKKC